MPLTGRGRGCSFFRISYQDQVFQDATAMTTLLTLLIGMFIGWNLPQPDWARAIQDKVVSLFQSLINK